MVVDREERREGSRNCFFFFFIIFFVLFESPSHTSLNAVTHVR